jgi:hypothetical protein
MDPTITIVWTRKSFIVALWCHARFIFRKLGLKISDGPKAAITISVATESTGDLTNRNELLLFFPRPLTALGT